MLPKMVNYLNKYILRLAELYSGLWDLTHQNDPFEWVPEDAETWSNKVENNRHLFCHTMT